MLLSEPQASGAGVARRENQARMPSPELLRTLSADDLRTLRNALAESPDYISNELFDAPDAEQVLLTAPSNVPEAAELPGNPDDSGVHPAEDGSCPSARGNGERHVFLKLNYCRRRVQEVLLQSRGRRLNAKALEELLYWEHIVQQTREEIIRDNVGLVMAMARRTRVNGTDPADLMSEGSLALLRAANKFDCARGYRFSTYACRAILKSFSRVALRTARYRGRFPAAFDPSLERSRHADTRRVEVSMHCIEELRCILEGDVGNLSEVERRVIRARFALDHDERADGKGKTLEQVGELIGVTKERVRQIQNKALEKLRLALDQTVLA